MDQISETIKNLSASICLDGALHRLTTKEQSPVYNPATLENIGTIPMCTPTEIDLAVLSAEQAQENWSQMPASERGKLVYQCGQVIAANADLLAQIMSVETGKAIRTESKVEITAVVDIFSFYAGLALELKGETIPFHPDMLAYTIREPLGVVGAIIPWNVPLMLMATKVAPALVAGNTVVLKPSPEASFCVLKAVELMNKILPPGVINVVTGAGDTGKALVFHPKVHKIAFTGSVESGRDVYTTAAKKIIPVTLELGGKSPMIICADADIDAAVKSVFEGMRFTRQGQSCSAASRLLVHAEILDVFVEKLVDHLNQYRMGDPLDEKTDIGTIVSQRQYDKIKGFIETAEADPTLILHYACKLPSDPRLSKGLFIRPLIITGLTNEHIICQKEIFGPVLAVMGWDNLEEALAIANDTEFGLAAGIWTKDLPTALQATKKLQAGFVQVNQYIVFRPSLPFGGYKNSGLGKEASLEAMVQQYTKEKTVIINMT